MKAGNLHWKKHVWKRIFKNSSGCWMFPKTTKIPQYFRAQRTLLSGPWWPKWEGNPAKKEYIYTSGLPSEKVMAPPSSTPAWKIPWIEEPGGLHAVHEVAKSRTRLSDFTFTFHFPTLEKEMATHSSVLAWRIPGTGEPGGLPSMGSHGVGYDWSRLAAAAHLERYLELWRKTAIPEHFYF